MTEQQLPPQMQDAFANVRAIMQNSIGKRDALGTQARMIEATLAFHAALMHEKSLILCGAMTCEDVLKGVASIVQLQLAAALDNLLEDKDHEKAFGFLLRQVRTIHQHGKPINMTIVLDPTGHG